MGNCFLSNYNLSCLEVLQSILISEYGLRHLRQAAIQPERQWEHRLIAVIEFVPLLGQIAMLIEWVTFQILYQDSLANFPRKELLFKGSQAQAEGQLLNTEKVFRLVEDLNQRREPGILFNPSSITQIIAGGVCTAMSLDFAEKFLKLRKVHLMTDEYSNDLFLSSIRNLGQRFAQCSEEMRTWQMAFNTIEVTSNPPGIDIGKNKIQSLVNLHGFKVDYASREIPVDREDYERTLKEEESKLPNGLYLLRTIRPFNNVREEWHGHSMIYVKNQKEGYFYDPNEGAKYMRNIDHLPELAAALANCHRWFETSRARFYRLALSAPMQP